MTTSHISILVLLSLSLAPLSFSEKCHPNDKKALLQIKKDLHNPPILTTWEPKSDCCSKWHGVQCDKKTNRITQLDLSNTKLTGKIPQAISKLSNLETLDLHNNLLTGPVPASLGNLKKLTSIDLSSNRLEGDLSFVFEENKGLETANFSSNAFSFDLTNIKFADDLFSLYLDHNKIYGSLPKDLSSTGIINLNVSYNRLCGPIPELRRAQLFDKSVFSHNKCLCGKPLPACK